MLTNNLRLVVLIDHPLVQPILESEELQFRFERLGSGQLQEVLLIGATPEMNRLMRDPQIRKLVNEIDLEELVQQVTHRPSTQSDGANREIAH